MCGEMIVYVAGLLAHRASPRSCQATPNQKGAVPCGHPDRLAIRFE